MTVHWLFPDLKRESAAHTCCRFTGSHTNKRIAEVIFDAHNFHDIALSKIITTITDNACNVAKAFSEYMVVEDGIEPIGKNLKKEKLKQKKN